MDDLRAIRALDRDRTTLFPGIDLDYVFPANPFVIPEPIDLSNSIARNGYGFWEGDGNHDREDSYKHRNDHFNGLPWMCVAWLIAA
jgi:hypothetical protein